MKKILNNLAILIGILLICYPLIGNLINQFNKTTVISKYRQEVNTMTEEDKEDLKNQYKKYNDELSNNEAISKLDCINIGDILGYISIPKISVYLPIYEGTSSEILAQGVGHLEETSYPTGEKSTNCVLAGHTGLTAKKFFDDLDEMEINDVFYIYVLDDVFKYEVSDIQVVLPDETDKTKIVEGEELVTLVTCTPKYFNSHRLLVIGSRVEEETVQISDEVESETNVFCNYKFWIIFVLIVVTILGYIAYNIRRLQ